MARPLITAISAGARALSRTTALVRAAADRTADLLRGDVEFIELSEVHPLLRSQSREGLGPEGEALIQRIERADLLVVGSPVYRASYTGLFKHLFDLVDHRALAGRVVLLAATGGSLEHSLVIEHQFRPLFGFFGALTVPTGLYAQPSDIEGGVVIAAGLQERIERAAAEAAFLFNRSHQAAAAAHA